MGFHLPQAAPPDPEFEEGVLQGFERAHTNQGSLLFSSSF
jgi:hypothetical protein